MICSLLHSGPQELCRSSLDSNYVMLMKTMHLIHLTSILEYALYGIARFLKVVKQTQSLPVWVFLSDGPLISTGLDIVTAN